MAKVQFNATSKRLLRQKNFISAYYFELTHIKILLKESGQIGDIVDYVECSITGADRMKPTIQESKGEISQQPLKTKIWNMQVSENATLKHLNCEL